MSGQVGTIALIATTGLAVLAVLAGEATTQHVLGALGLGLVAWAGYAWLRWDIQRDREVDHW